MTIPGFPAQATKLEILKIDQLIVED